MSVHKEVKRITTHILQEMKNHGEKIAMLTAYDYSMATIVDAAGMDIILVGDSASNVMAGHETTLPITLDQMIYHASSVVRAIKRALVVVDLPFGSYQGNSKEALNSAFADLANSNGTHFDRPVRPHNVDIGAALVLLDGRSGNRQAIRSRLQK